jgi:hypothetical protein
MNYLKLLDSIQSSCLLRLIQLRSGDVDTANGDHQRHVIMYFSESRFMLYGLHSSIHVADGLAV